MVRTVHPCRCEGTRDDPVLPSALRKLSKSFSGLDLKADGLQAPIYLFWWTVSRSLSLTEQKFSRGVLAHFLV